jgi:hypothetical protein
VTACNSGYALSGANCVLINAARQIAPLSTSTVTSQRPTLRWELGSGSDGVHLEVCHDRACSSPIYATDVSATSWRPPTPLSPGVVFWRITGRSGATMGTAVSPTWQFTVGHGNSSVDTSWGTAPDVNGDGYSDLLVGDSGNPPSYPAHVYVHLGSSSGVASSPATTLNPMYFLAGATVGSAGDVDGDGFSDVFVLDLATVEIYRGGASGLSSTPATTFSLTTPTCSTETRTIIRPPVLCEFTTEDTAAFRRRRYPSAEALG